MVGKNNAALIAQIGAMSIPEITEGKSIDFSNAVNSFLKGKQLGESFKEKQLQDQRRQGLVDAINSGNQDEINSALASYNPVAYAQMLKSDAQRAEDRQWALDDMATKHQRDLELAKIKNNGLVNINMSNPFDKKRIEKVASEMDANISRAQEMKTAFEQANNALKNINTGTLLATFTKNKPLFSNADEEAFDSAAAKSIDMVRKAGTGPMTDADAKRYEKASIDRGKSKDANQLLIDSGMIASDNAIAMEELRADWITNGGNLGDFDKAWRNYLNNNPIFGNDGKINKSRQDAYTWFSKPQAPSLKNFNQTKEEQAISDGTVIEDANGNRMILRGGQWQAM